MGTVGKMLSLKNTYFCVIFKLIYFRSHSSFFDWILNILGGILSVLFTFIILYRPQRSCGKVTFLHLCHSVHRGSATPPLCRHLSGVDTPLGRHSLPLGRHSFPLGRPPGQTPLHRHPPGQTPPHADTPPEQTPPGQTSPPAQYILGYGQQAGSMHPTGMHSCLY